MKRKIIIAGTIILILSLFTIVKTKMRYSVADITGINADMITDIKSDNMTLSDDLKNSLLNGYNDRIYCKFVETENFIVPPETASASFFGTNKKLVTIYFGDDYDVIITDDNKYIAYIK